MLAIKLGSTISRWRRFLSPRRRALRFLHLHDYHFPHERDEFERPTQAEEQVKPDALNSLFERAARQWRSLGTAEPYWSVLSAPKYLRSDIDVEAFYSTGAKDVGRLIKCFARCHASISNVRSVLELGCGVGRITQFLARKFHHVTAVDISPPHIALAKERIDRERLTNVEFVTLTSVAQCRDFPKVDLFYSIITLQHNPPPVIREILSVSLDAIVPGGYAYFQLITQAIDYRFDAEMYLARPEGNPIPEMHPLSQATVFCILATLDFEVIEVRVDGSGDPAQTISNVFFARRRLKKAQS